MTRFVRRLIARLGLWGTDLQMRRAIARDDFPAYLTAYEASKAFRREWEG